MIDLFQPGAYARTAGGNLERPDIQKQAIRWMSWSINEDNGGGGNSSVWMRCRGMWDAAGISNFPWLHCHTVADVDRLISVAKQSSSPAIGLNIEDVAGDGFNLQALAGHIKTNWNGAVHLATEPWVQNSQGWEYFSFAVVALEINPDENEPSKHIADCIFHAKSEGIPQPTLMLKTRGFTPAYYGEFWDICHSLYTADDIDPLPEAWAVWVQAQPCKKGDPVPPTPDPWYTKPYRKGTAVGPAVLPRIVRPPTNSNMFRGYDISAYKRACCRAGRWGEWAPSEWDNIYWKVFALGKGTGKVVDSGIRGIERQEGLAQDGIINDQLYQKMRRILVPEGPHKGEPIFDGIAVRLLNQALKEYGPGSEERRIREAITDFCLRSEAAEDRWHYTQNRPFTGMGDAPEVTHENDCSSYAILAYYHARQVTGIKVVDPSGYSYTSYGNTWDDLDGHPRVTSGNYLVGDLAHYDGHVTICRKAGDANSSVWSSFGSEFGPEGLSLYYRGDFIKVVRPDLVP